jgi:hypothetical protein
MFSWRQKSNVRAEMAQIRNLRRNTQLIGINAYGETFHAIAAAR